MKTHIYKGNQIIEYSETEFCAFYLNEDNEIENKQFPTLEKAQKFLDNGGYSLND